ncbi:MAG TPA: pyrimidine dimer DNA glycosylase/endonuclease V [Verrucomicrobiae bacterium]|nr:pyrimidine dimer DNA glycosylase/endonuclease V [Verrucomicrobiae bacterium]
MRIWDIPPKKLCRQHLLGEHRELHALWTILTKGKEGYARHPETLRWRGKTKALYRRHEMLVGEFERRGYRHSTPLSKKLALGRTRQNEFVNTMVEQRRLLKGKKCDCDV